MRRADPQECDFSILSFAGPGACRALASDIASLGYRHRIENGGDWLRRCSGPARRPKVVLIGDPAGGAVPEIVRRLQTTPWVCILGRGNVGPRRDLMREATEFLQSPWSPDELAVRLERFTTRLDRRPADLVAELPEIGIVGSAPAFLAALDSAARIARSPAHVLLEGETGTGKELVARLIHRLSGRGRAFVPVNCGCLPPELVESELFGHEAGAFTGAASARAGLVRQADGGTLFLDEVDALSPRAQVALLRFLQDGEVRPLGSAPARVADVRVLAASNRPLAQLVAAGGFREDLYFRLGVLTVTLPALRDRPGDVGDLARHFVDRFAASYGRGQMGLTDEAVEWLALHELPGNVRQLENLIHRAVLTAPGRAIGLAELAPPGTAPTPGAAPAQAYDLARARALEAFERRYLTGIMDQTGGNVTAAAQRAGKERRSFGRLLKKHRLGPHWQD